MTLDAEGGPAGAPDLDGALARARAGDAAAFRLIVQAHGAPVARHLGRLLDDPRDVEEAIQDTFVQAWRHLAGFRGDAALSTWLHRIATNVALMQLRRRRPRPVSLDLARSEPRAVGTPFDDAVADRLDALAPARAALAALPADLRVIVVLRDVEGLANDQVAALLALSLPAVKSRLHRGRMALRRHLARSGALAVQ